MREVETAPHIAHQGLYRTIVYNGHVRHLAADDTTPRRIIWDAAVQKIEEPIFHHQALATLTRHRCLLSFRHSGRMMAYPNHVRLTKRSHFDHRTNSVFVRPRTALNNVSPCKGSLLKRTMCHEMVTVEVRVQPMKNRWTQWRVKQRADER